ncbi:MAG TPA: 1-(5-phosphoribosyl)-5-[(5-phosphoribosylamino)methylideneamino]imidazole-4-carboxamide isomerase [Chitinophagaceae bacterium]|nr:1-(5-phosphoribosyl)-5-[(5-phosphoribosylamino)methylideneamino]imidazole-4-carboxamide isomerase [Chitinophagaceae bacterium]
MDIIPAIDIIEGKCVRLSRGDYAQKKVYNEHPLEVALKFEDAGIKRLHLVDLDGAKAGDVKNWKVLEKIAGKTRLSIDFSGGISSKKNLDITFNSGAAFASIGSIAVQDEITFTEWLYIYGSEKFIIGADVKEEKIAVKGWTALSDMLVSDLIKKYLGKDVKQFFCTDISKDGILAGPSFDLYGKILADNPGIYLIASGGVAALRDIKQLNEIGCSGVIIGKALYENRITLTELKPYL